MKSFDNIISKTLKLWSKELKSGPSLATLRVTNICNLKCKFCTAKNEKPLKDELNLKDYKRLFSELNKLNVKMCGIVGGGEALCKKKLTLAIVKLIKKYGMTGWLVTNGINFDSKSIKELILSKMDTILFSLDGTNKDTHDSLRGVKGAFDKTISNIKLFNNLKEKLGSDKPDLKIQMLVTKKSYTQIEDMINLSKSLKTKELLLNFLVEHTPECKKLKLNEKEFHILKKKLEHLLQDKKIKKFTNFEDFLHIMTLVNSKKAYKKNRKYILGHCYQPWYHLNITERGDINFCPEMYKWQKENIKKKTTNKIWYSKNLTKFREKIKEKKLIGFCNKYCNLPIIVENLKIAKLLENESRKRKNK